MPRYAMRRLQASDVLQVCTVDTGDGAAPVQVVVAVILMVQGAQVVQVAVVMALDQIQMERQAQPTQVVAVVANEP